jgi:hypothetical protein
VDLNKEEALNDLEEILHICNRKLYLTELDNIRRENKRIYFEYAGHKFAVICNPN